MKEALNTNKMRLACLIAVAFLMTSMPVITYVPIVKAQSPQHTATVSPATTNVPEVKYTLNVTNKSTDDINKTNIIYPSGFTYQMF